MYKIPKILQTPQTNNFLRTYMIKRSIVNNEGQIRKTSVTPKNLEFTTPVLYKSWNYPQYIRTFSTNKEKTSTENEIPFRNKLLYGFVVLTTSVAGLYVYYTKFIKSDEKKSPELVENISTEPSKKSIPRYPPTSEDIPDDIPYLLIGGGTASFSAFRAIKSLDPTAKILVISNESNYPYMRPPLSKEIWYNEDRQLIKKLKFKQWNGSERSLFYEPEDFYMDCKDLPNARNGGVSVARGYTVKKIDCLNKKVYLDDGKEITYGKCLIATGAKPKNLKVFENAGEDIQKKVTLFRTIYDFENLENVLSKDVKSVVVVGGGFLGSEISCALARYGKNKMSVKQIFAENGNMAKVLPGYLSLWTTDKVKSEGVDVTPSVKITKVEMTPRQQVELTLTSGEKINVDHVILAVGVEPNTDLANVSNLEVDPEVGGFVVNAELEARSNLYVAGDCACFYDTKLGRRRIEHHDHAVVSGRLAGENMTGARKPYTHQSMFWSDLGPDIGYEAIGIVDSRLPTVAVFAKPSHLRNNQLAKLASDQQNSINVDIESPAVPSTIEENKVSTEASSATTTLSDVKLTTSGGDEFSKGLIFYLRDNIVVGIVLWNLFNRMSIARQVINEHRSFDDLSEVAKLFNIYEEP
ncbi:apoptosis-inducing factor 1, mitochondrial isoform X2 [Chrysoperla carnea]|uniref:apoptosis-inducing factor 1, mitochondrial isoform X2 n=1 Tax=Chrysoperla carnea TaxID=189513 RepID=UPI001D06FBFD|nr:apoptosis-inducing factor 1, mitochondrial isoform X2 [Chrysoperla carnea]